MNTSSRTLSSDWRHPINVSAHQKGGIHDDATAQKLGFAGGTIAGSLHMEQFPPQLVAHFGDDWWRRGNLSLYFTAATIEGDAVQSHLQPQGGGQARAWIEKEDGTIVLDGTAYLGEDANSALRRRLADVRPATDLRMLADVRVGATCGALATRAADNAIDERLQVITEPLAVYENLETTKAAYGGRVLPFAPLVHLMRAVEPSIAPVRGPFVGLFGAIEIQYLNGPILSETDYLVSGKALAVSESPKTEILWYEATLFDSETKAPLARMLKMDRLLKNSSPLFNSES